jgi:hypothetical protein
LKFWLGTNMTRWLTRVDVPLFVSHRRLAREHKRNLPVAVGEWCCDSGAFTEVASFGRFVTSAADYVAALRRYRDEIGNLVWASPQDHMCEPWVLARSEIASTVAQAQAWTVDNYIVLRSLDDTLPIIPVLQGQTLRDYRDHVAQYERVGVDLRFAPLVGLGSVCRRQATDEIAMLIASLNGDGLSLHGFGVKGDGLRRYGWCLDSADSMAWSYRGRKVYPCPVSTNKNCTSCLHFALEWRDKVVQGRHDRPVQMGLML